MTKRNVFSRKQRIYLPFKRFCDICISFFLILLFIPFFFIISIIVLFDTGAFPVFRQKRIGKNNKEFLILKFRSMNKNAPREVPTDQFVNPDKYISRFGKFIRKTSIDELPQLFNVFLGQMSFIGPRPALWNQKDLIEKRVEYNLHLIRPGLSGWAQCNGRDKVTTSQKVELDKEYLTKLSLLFDIKIFFMSIWKALIRKDVVEGKQS